MDMDAFFASVEQLTRPTVRDRPVLVGGLGPRGTVAGASYEAREFGARSAMPMSEARRRCPVAVVLPPRFRVYQALSERVLDLVRGVSEVTAQVSVDEAFLEPGELAGAATDTVAEFAARLRATIRGEVGVTASVGAASGKQLAKIASGLAKPDGARVVPPDEERALLWSLEVRAMWGVGPVTESKLHRIGVQTIGDLAGLHLGDVVSLLGQAHGTELHRLAHGIDDHPVVERAESKQVSAETTFDVDVRDADALAAEVASMAEGAHSRLVASHRAAKTVTLKVRDSDFTTLSRSETLPSASSDLATLSTVSRRLIGVAVVPGTPIRLVGVSYSGLTSSEQEPLFADESQAPDSPLEPDAPSAPVPERASADEVPWRAGDDLRHEDFGHGWVQGAGHGRVTARFETATTGPGRARTFSVADPHLVRADPMDSLG